jgi:release factor glutamine methyltransferase
LAKHLPNAQITAVDRSEVALALAKQNAEAHGLSDRIQFVHSDWFSAFHPTIRNTVISRSAVGYCCQQPSLHHASRVCELAKTVREFEPVTALVSGPEGTEDIQKACPTGSRSHASWWIHAG